MEHSKDVVSSEMLPPPPPVLPANVVPLTANRVPMARRGLASRGTKIQLQTNHFKVRLQNTKEDFYHYSVAMTYEDGTQVDAKNVGRRVLEKVHEVYSSSDFNGKYFAYDGEKSLFTIGSLPRKKLEFTVIMDDVSSNRRLESGSLGGEGSPIEGDKKRSRGFSRSKTYKVAINFAAKIPIQAIANALRGIETEHFQEAVRVLDIILRQNAAKQGCLLVRQSFFHNHPRNFVEIGGGVVGCRGFHSSFRATQGGLSLNVDVSTTMLVKPGPVIKFLLDNQNVSHPDKINWIQAKKTLKNLRVKAANSNLEYKITGLSEEICGKQKFAMKLRNGKEGDPESVEVTVFKYFVEHRDIKLEYSEAYPCINVGKPKRPTYIPIELCELVSLQRYTRALSGQQKASLVEKSRQKPQERKTALSQALGTSNYNADPLLSSSGISINGEFTTVQGRVLAPPKLTVGKNENFIPRNGRWNFNNKTLVDPKNIERWCIVNFNARCDLQNLSRSLIRCGQMKGITISEPFKVFQERRELSNRPPSFRVEKMIEEIQSNLPGAPQFLLCLLPERKNSKLYGPWKKRNLSDLGVVTQCISPQRVNDQYLTNVLLKINAKLGGINSLLAIENSHSIPTISEVPTLIVGMDVSHGSATRPDLPSIAAVVSSRQWPLISRYRAAVRTQSPKLEMIDSLFKPVEFTKDQKVETVDQGIFRELLMDFYQSSEGKKPEHIIIFRDGVSESQFNQVLNIELDQILEACKFLDAQWFPKFTVVVAQKNHHTKFFQANSPDNVPPGTVIDSGICHAKNNDFYMCAHAGMIGTTRPTHYHVLHDEIGFSADDLQELVHSLSYVYQRSTTAISIVAPICYAHLAASQMSQFIKFEEQSEQSSGHGGLSAVPELPKLHRHVSSSMFFC
ncbi:unnamed protein product [Fraxinus pennsylvanica]|uniref:Argonaute 4 n=1 Tax=Fraxinus pennsylvanica TaxID=56036 RepID=A0AAD2E8W5_9LAMI|nr:unnamed protein product [Fraxinus pennsylvanica]